MKLLKHNICGRVLSVLLAVTVGAGTLLMAPSISSNKKEAAPEANAGEIPVAADSEIDKLTEISPQEAGRLMSANESKQDNQAVKAEQVNQTKTVKQAEQAKVSARIEDFRSNTHSIPIGETQSVIFRAKLSGGVLGAQELKVVDGSQSLIGYMHDDGQNGDETAADGTYTLQVSLSSDKEETVSYYAYTKDSVSAASTIEFFTPFSSEEWDAIHSAENKLCTFIAADEFQQKPDNEKAEAVGGLLGSMAEKGEIIADSISYDEDSMQYYFEYASSTPGVIMLRDYFDGVDRSDSAQEDDADSGAFSAQADVADNASTVSVVNAAGSASVGANGNRALILYGFGNDPDWINPYYNLRDALNAKGLNTDLDIGVTVDDMKNIDSSYDLVVFSMHGSEKEYSGSTYKRPVLCLDQAVTYETDIMYDYEINTRKSVLKVTLVSGKNAYWVTPKLFSDNYSNGGLNGKLIFADCCKSFGCEGHSGTEDNILANALINCSAKAVIGYRNSVGVRYSNNILKYVIEATFDGAILVTAVNNAKKKYGENDGWENPAEDKYKAYPILYPDGSNFILRKQSEDIKLNTEKTAVINSMSGVKYYKFVPSRDMPVKFSSTGNSDTIGYLYDAKWSKQKFDDNSGSGNNFSLTYYLKANTTYYFGCGFTGLSDTGSFKVKLIDTSKPISACSIALSPSSFIFDNKEKYPEVKVMDGSTVLKKDTNYTLKYENNKKAGEGSVIITGIGNYSGSVTRKFNISYDGIYLGDTKSVNIKTAGEMHYYKFVPSSTMKVQFYSTGSSDTCGYLYNSDLSKMWANDDNSGESKNFSISYKLSANTTYILACKLKNKSEKGSFYVKLINSNFSDCSVTLNSNSFYYNGKAICPAVTVKNDTATLTKGTHYTVKYENNKNVGTGKVIVTGIGNYKGFVTKTFTISLETISLNAEKTIKISTAGDTRYFKFVPSSDTKVQFYSSGNYDTCGYLYNSNMTQLKSEDDNGLDLNFNISYTLLANTTYIFACRHSRASATGTFKVKLVRDNISDCEITLNSSSYIFDGKAKCPSVTVKKGSTTLKKDTHYKVSYEDNTYVGTARVIVEGIGSYSGFAFKSYTIAYDTIALNASKTVNISTAGGTRYYKFVPTSNMTVQFYSTGNYDTYGSLYEMYPVTLAYDDNSGDKNNFKVTYTLTANRTYVFACRLRSASATGVFTVKLVKYSAKNEISLDGGSIEDSPGNDASMPNAPAVVEDRTEEKAETPSVGAPATETVEPATSESKEEETTVSDP